MTFKKARFWVVIGGMLLLRSVGVIQVENPPLNKSLLASVMSSQRHFHEFPTTLDLPLNGKTTPVSLKYTFDPQLQKKMESLFQAYRPDYGALVAIEPNTGRVLSVISYSIHEDMMDNLALRATFPAASIFKVVTAAAAIAEKKFSPSTMIPFSGRNHTLFRHHILNTSHWTRTMSLKEAFALSVNTVFGKIGAYAIGAEGLRNYANRFGFNRKIAADVPVQEGKVSIIDDPWALAETASGYTRDNTMSPLQGALIAAAVANDGLMMEPFAVQSVHNKNGDLLYEGKSHLASQTVDAATAAEIRELMRETITHGTSRRAFRGFFRKSFSQMDVGGKTGSLSGIDPAGKYDWFVGYANFSGKSMALATLTIHEKLWRVKSSYIARKAIENYFENL